MNAYAKAIAILEDGGLDYKAIVFEVARIAPAVLIRAVEKPPEWISGAREWMHGTAPGRYIEAIKHCRAKTGWSLKAAKDAIDKLFPEYQRDKEAA